MGANEYPQVLQSFVGWAEIGMTLDIDDGESITTKAFSAIDWSDKLEGAKILGAGPWSLGRTTGMYDADGSMTMYRAAFNAFQKALSKRSAMIGTVVFDVTVSWSPLDADNATSDNVYTSKLIGCRIMTRQVSNAPGSDGAMVVVPLSVMRCVDMIDGQEISLV